MIKMRKYLWPILAMCIAVTLSNVLVNYRISWLGLDDFLTYGAFTYPFAFLINDLTNRSLGPLIARRVVYAGFFAGLVVSFLLADTRIAIAAGAAFLFGQLTDIFVFTPLRRNIWWKAPLCAAFAGSIIDTLLFFSIAFAPSFSFLDLLNQNQSNTIYEWTSLFGVSVPVWVSLAFGDFLIKIVMALFMLLPYGALLMLFFSQNYKKTENH